MKKYRKPMMLIEEYRPSCNVAACGWDMNQQDKNTCVAYKDWDLQNIPDYTTIMFNDYQACTVTPEREEGFCYFTGADEHARIFTS